MSYAKFPRLTQRKTRDVFPNDISFGCQWESSPSPASSPLLVLETLLELDPPSLNNTDTCGVLPDPQGPNLKLGSRPTSVLRGAQAQGEGRAVSVRIPPGRDAQLSPRPSAALMERNRNIRSIRRLGRREWHKRSGYSKRSMVENAIYRYKTIIGRGMRSRTLAGQRVEVQLACGVLNTMTRLGMPDSYRVG
jgi:hypothetical protein